MDNDDSSADRSFFRVKTSLPLRVTRTPADDYQRLSNEILTRVDASLPEIDVELLGWLDRMERKLDRLLSHYDLIEYSTLDERDRQNIELSGSGLSFQSDEAIACGTGVLLEFELPETPARTVRCLARVVQELGRDEAGMEAVGVSFEAIRQIDRDAIVRYTLAVQRQEIRSKGDTGS
jgi:hypothetical protein